MAISILATECNEVKGVGVHLRTLLTRVLCGYLHHKPHLCLHHSSPVVEDVGRKRVVGPEGLLEDVDGSEVERVSLLALALLCRV